MEYTLKQYSNSEKDYINILDFFSELCTLKQTNISFSMTRFELWIYYNSAKGNDFYSNNCFMWIKDKKIAGLFISEEGINDFHIIVRPGHEKLENEIFNWMRSHWANKKDSLWTQVNSNHKMKIELLTSNGFMKCEDVGYTRTYDLMNMKLEVKLPNGYYIKSANQQLNLKSRIYLIRNAFDYNDYSEEIYLKAQSLNTYRSDLDLSVFNQEGEHVSTCMAWVDEKNLTAEIETVGTHKNHLQKGLARAVITEALLRLRNKGYKTASIGSGKDLTTKFYDSFGYITRETWLEYSWDK